LFVPVVLDVVLCDPVVLFEGVALFVPVVSLLVVAGFFSSPPHPKRRRETTATASFRAFIIFSRRKGQSSRFSEK